MTAGKRMSDGKLLLLLGGAMLLVVAAAVVLSRHASEEDPRPLTTNAGPQGAMAAFLTLQRLGRNVQRWEQPAEKLDGVDAAHTTLVLAQPALRPDQKQYVAATLERFMQRGGRVLLTGPAWASLLPGGEAGTPGLLSPKICETTPEGPGELARVGSVEMADYGGWTASGPQFRVAQRCVALAVVVSFPVGRGEAIWWSSATPLTNAGLKNDGNLKLMLASLYGNGGSGRAVLFDDYLQTAHGEYHPLAGLPLWWLLMQVVVLFVLLVLSFSRRKGPLRMPVALPRSSPVEFANSMGDLYEKARATSAATEAARRRLLGMLHRDAGVAKASIDAGPEAIAEALQQRLGGDWSVIAKHLDEAHAARSADIAPGSALALVRALAEDEGRVREKLKPAGVTKASSEEVLDHKNADSESFVEV